MSATRTKAAVRHNPSRRSFLKGGSALVVGFSFGGIGNLAAQVVTSQRGVLAGPPDPMALDSWIAIHTDNTATVFFGKCELGQGNTTALLQIAAEELDLNMGQVSAAKLDTNVTPDQGGTSSSSSVERGGPQVRVAAATARSMLLSFAGRKLGVTPLVMEVSNGVILIDGFPTKSVTYGELVGDSLFSSAIAANTSNLVLGSAPRVAANALLSATATLKTPGEYKVVGTNVPRVDIPAKAAGTYDYMQNIRLDGMWHGRIVRPRGQGAYGKVAKPISIDQESIRGIPDAQIVRKGDFLGVVASSEWLAIQAAERLLVQWDVRSTLPGNEKLYEQMREGPSTETIVADAGDVPGALSKATHKVWRKFYAPYQMHGPIGPNCAIADVTENRTTVMCSTLNIYATRRLLANVLKIPEAQIRVKYYQGAGGFGHSCFNDATLAAGILSQAVGKPVRVQFMRQDENGWDNYGSAHVAEVTAGIDAAGKITAYEYHGWQHAWMVTETAEELAIGSKFPEASPAGTSQFVRLKPVSMYDAPNRRIVNHRINMLGYLKGSYLRSPLDLALAFASEQVIDELAEMAKLDPLIFRRRNITDPRWIAVLDAVAAAAKWKPKVFAAQKSGGDILRGRGIGLSTHHVSYGAAIADVEVNRKSGLIVVKRMYGALDAGLAINPRLVENQVIGMMTQAASRMLKEEVTFDQKGVTSLDWEGYKTLRFAEHPTITPIVIQKMDRPSTGAGEEVMGAAAAAIANAVYDATRIRFHQYPMTPSRVQASLAQNSRSGT